MANFATTEDLEARWRVLSASEKTKAETLLGDASAQIRARFTACGKDISKADTNILKQVCCAMVRRVMDTPSDLFGVTQSSQTAGSYSQSYTYSGTSGEMFLKKNELKALGLSAIRIQSIHPHIGYGDVDYAYGKDF